MDNYIFEIVYRTEKGGLYTSFHHNVSWDDVCEIIGKNPDHVVIIDLKENVGDLNELHPNSGMKKIEEIFWDHRNEIEQLKLEVEALKGFRHSNQLLEKENKRLGFNNKEWVERNRELVDENKGLTNELETINTMLKTFFPNADSQIQDFRTILTNEASENEFDYIKAMGDDGK